MSNELREMIEAASQFAELVMLTEGSLAPVWHAQNAAGKNFFIPGPPTDDKDLAALMMRRLLQDFAAVRVVFVDECWYATDEAGMRWIKTHGSLSNYPNRKEAVIMQAEDDQGRHLTGRRAIIRDGKKVTLGPLTIDAPIESEGRFVGMLATLATKH